MWALARGPFSFYRWVVSNERHVEMARAVYDASAEGYVGFVGVDISPATECSVDRSLLTAFVELVAAGPVGRLADIGCGPGRVAAFLASHQIEGRQVIGFDVSTALLDIARKAHPTITFEEGKLTDLPVADASLAGAVCWYSIIHTPPDDLDEVCVELARAVVPGGWVLLAFQAGHGEGLHRDNAHGTQLPLTSYLHDPDDLIRALIRSGLQLYARAMREPELAHELSPQAFIIARAEPRHARTVSS